MTNPSHEREPDIYMNHQQWPEYPLGEGQTPEQASPAAYAPAPNTPDPNAPKHFAPEPYAGPPKAPAGYYHPAPVVNVTQTMAVNVRSSKSVGVAVLLAFFFGPLGMLYSTVTGAVVMFFVNLIVGIPTYGFGLLLTWPVCVIWAAIAANNHNQQSVRTVSSTGDGYGPQ